MDIRSVLHITFIWAVTSSLILVPNITAYYFLKPYLGRFGYAAGFSLFLAWFIINYLYLKTIQPVIDRVFNKQKFNLQRLEVQFVENISLLKTLEELARVFAGTLQKNLYFRDVDIFIRLHETENYRNQGGKEIAVDGDIRDWFIGANHLVGRDMVLADPYYLYIREKMLSLLDANNSRYILPLVQNNELIGVALLGERLNLKELNPDETRFLNSVRSALSISISNSLMYQDLSDLKDNLEDKVAKRTEELLGAMEKVEAVNEKLTRTNDELNSARKIAEMDMMMAVNVQKSLLPAEPPETPGWDVALAFKPMAGISGDFYDFYTEDGDLKGLVLLDVSGHGIASGLITMIARSVFQRNFFRYNDVKLGSVVEEANRDLINEIENVDNYLTGIVLRFTDDAVEYVNAGHPDLILRQSGSGVVSMVNSRDRNFRGSFLGVREMDFPYRTLRFGVEQGDVLLVYTDGIAEGINAEKAEYGSEGLARALHRAPGESSRSILDYIMHDFHAFTGGRKLSDDLTLIVIRKK
jgi:serine phosphatase RsbU (regulator of sigma subunit)